MNAIIIDSSPLFMIIDRATIKMHGLVLQTLSELENIDEVLIIEDKTSKHVNNCLGCQPKDDLQPFLSILKGESPMSPSVPQTSRLLASLVLEPELLFTVPLPAKDDKTETPTPCSTTSNNADILSLW